MGKHSRKWIFGILILGIVSLCLVYANTLGERAVKKTVSLALNAINAKKVVLVSIDQVDLNFTKGSIRLKGIKLEPDSLYFEKFKNGDLSKRILTEIWISEIELTGLGIKKMFWEGRIDSANVSLKDLITNIYLAEQKGEASTVASKKHPGVLDSLHLKGLKHIDLGVIKLNKYQLNLLDGTSKDTLSSLSGDYLELDQIDLMERQGGDHLFELRTENFGLTLKNQLLRLPKNEYTISLGSLEFNNSEQTLKLVDFRYSPLKSLEHLASKKKYADDLFDVHFKDLTVNGLDINSYRADHLGSIKKISISGMELKILRNKQKPENTGKRPLLPHQSLKKLNYPIHIGQIAIANSSLTYKEIQPKNAKDFFTVNLTDLNVMVNYLTSIKDSLASGTPLTIALNSRLLNKAKMDINITMPYNHRNNAFHYTGNIGPAELSIFNPLLSPAAHIAIKEGKLEGIHYSVKASPQHADGELTMRYSDIHIDIQRKNQTMEHALSFLASSLVHSSNPKKNGKLRVAKVSYARPLHKGLGGYLTKSVLSGVINSIEPFGKNKVEATDIKPIKSKKKAKPKKSRKNRKSS